MEVVLWVLAGALAAIGVAGSVLPGLPGAPLVLGGCVLGAWLDRFERVGPGTLAVLAALTVLSMLVDPIAAALGARKMGASRWAVVGAVLGLLAGLFLGIPGLLLGPLVGAVAGELLAGRDVAQAGRAGLGAWLGFLLGSVAKLGIAATMAAIFAFAWFR
jgi:uncharacterized protein